MTDPQTAAPISAIAGQCPAPDTGRGRQPARRRRWRMLTASVTLALLALQTGCSTLEPGAGAPSAKTADDTASGKTRASRGGAAQDDSTDALPSVELTEQILYQMVLSEIALQRGQVPQALATYLSLARQTRDPRVARRATEIALHERAFERALEAAQIWSTAAPSSRQAAQTVESLQLSMGKGDDVAGRLEQRRARAEWEKTLPQFYADAVQLLARAPDKANALRIIESLAARNPSVPEARLAVAQIAAHASQWDRSIAEVRQLLALRPDFERGALLGAQVLQQKPDGAGEAIRLLGDFLARNPKSFEARSTYARLLATNNRFDEAREQFERLIADDPANAGNVLALAVLSYEAKRLDDARGLFQRWIELNARPRGGEEARDSSIGYSYLAQIAEDQRKPDEAIDWLSKIPASSEQFVPALIRRSGLMARQGQLDAARSLLRDAPVTQTRERTQLTLAESALLREAGRHQDSFQLLEQAVAGQPGNPELLYDLGMAGERINRLDVLESSMRKVIELKPDHAHAYNALGYTLADRNVRLTEARELIEKALSLAPNDPFIMDSMGWVQYRLGELDKSIATLRKAYELRPDAEIAAHLGEVLWVSGDREGARRLWREASGKEPDNETLRATLARLNVAL